VLTFALLITAIALRMRLGLVVFLPRWLCLLLRLWRTSFRRTRLRLRLWRAHLNVRLRCGTRGFHVRFRPALFGLGACAHLRRFVVLALLHGRCRVTVEAIRLLAAALRLRLWRLRAGLQREVEQMSERIGLPTRSEMDAAHRRIAELERSLRRLQAQVVAMAGTGNVDPVAQPAPAKVKPVARKAAKKAAPVKRAAAKKAPAKKAAPRTSTRTRDR